MMADYFGSAVKDVTEHAELRAQTAYNRNVAFVGGNLVANVRTKASGVCARVYKNGIWGFSSDGEYSEESVKRVLAAARSNALFMDSHISRGKGPLESIPPANFSFTREYVETDQKTLIDYAKELDSYIAEKYPDLSSRTVSVRSQAKEKIICTSEGSFARVIYPRAYVMVFLSTEGKDGDNLEIFDSIGGGEGYFGDFYSDPTELHPHIDSLHEELMHKKEGVFPKAGMCDCIIDSSLAGMLSHEAVGHTTEADLVLAGSVASHNLGKYVASPLISLTDFAYSAFGKKTPLPVYVDDEGVECTDCAIIKDGVLVGYMNNRESAMHFGMKPCGNARAFEFSDEPLIRMRNTAIHPGKDKLADMIASVDDGYYVTRSMNGQADTTGEFMFGIIMGYEIKNGKLGCALRDTTISGVAFDVLKTVTMLSDEVSWDFSGYCGKKQPMPVAMGGPAIKCRLSIGGR